MAGSSDTWSQLDGRCFISHSFADQESLAKLKEKMKSTSAELFVFEQVRSDPANPVSNGIVPEILKSQNLIYLEGGQSSQSFWVSFERDYALRSGLNVFAFDPADESLKPDEDDPLSLDIQVFHHRNDRQSMEELFEWMREHRNFELSPGVSRTRLGSISGDVLVILEQQLIRGGVVLYLCSRDSAGTIEQIHDPGMSSYIEGSPDFWNKFRQRRMRGFQSRDDPHSVFRYFDHAFYSVADPYEYMPGVYARIEPTLPVTWRPPGHRALDLLSGATEGPFNWNRVDDLIVRLYAAVLGYAHKRDISPPRARAMLEKDLHMIPIHWDNRRGTERVRIGVGDMDNAIWTLSIFDAQQLTNRCLTKLTKAFGSRPRKFDGAAQTALPIDRGFPARFAYLWNFYPQFVELSMDIEGPQANVFLRRFPVPKPMRKAAKAEWDAMLKASMPFLKV